MHEVEGLIARRDKLAAGAGKLKNATLCPLVQDFALLPLTDDLVIELKAYNADTKPALLGQGNTFPMRCMPSRSTFRIMAR
jgi:hypothetical protein